MLILLPASSSYAQSCEEFDDTTVWGIYYPISRLDGNTVRGFAETKFTGNCRGNWEPYITGYMHRDGGQIGPPVGELGPGPPGGTQDVFVTATLSVWGTGTYSLRAFHRARNRNTGVWLPPYGNGWDGNSYSDPNLTIQRPDRPDYNSGSPSVLWFLGGPDFSGQYTSRTIFTPGDPHGAPGTPRWIVETGADKLEVLCSDGSNFCPNPNAKAIGSSSGCQVYDVVVRTSYDGFLSEPFFLFINRPWNLVAALDEVGGEWVYSVARYNGYSTRVNYETSGLCLLDPRMTSYELNEQFAGQLIPDYPGGTNWPNQPPVKPGRFVDRSHWFDDISISNEFSQIGDPALCEGVLCIPQFTRPGVPPHDLVQHVGQSWFVGSVTSGTGARVQSNTLQMYTDSGWHTDIVTPRP